MTKIITCAELRYRGLEELQALFRELETELLRTNRVRSSARQCSQAWKTSAARWRHAAPGCPTRVRHPSGRRHAMPIQRRMVAESATADFPITERPAARITGAPLARMRRGVRRTGGAISTSMEDRAPNTDTGEPETSADALLDELVRACAPDGGTRL
jgi:hypothetical protein